MTKRKKVALPVVNLPPATIEKVVAMANYATISHAAVMRQAVSNFMDCAPDQQLIWITANYGKSVAFTNLYCSEDQARQIDDLCIKFDTPRAQVVRAAISFFVEKIL